MLPAVASPSCGSSSCSTRLSRARQPDPGRAPGVPNEPRQTRRSLAGHRHPRPGRTTHRFQRRTMRMSVERFPIGQEIDVTYPNFKVSLALLSATRLRFEIREGPFARTEVVDIQVVPLGNGLFAVSWQ